MRDLEKARANQTRYRAKHRDKLNAKQRARAKATRAQRVVYNRAYRAAHPEKVKAQRKIDWVRRKTNPKAMARRRAWVVANAKRLRLCRRKYMAAWRAANPEKALALYRAEYKRNAAKHCERARNQMAQRRAKYASAGVSPAEWQAIVAVWGGLCAYCGKPGVTVDHLVALARGGRHEPSNVVPACKRCNQRKQTMLPLEFIWRQAA